MWLAPLGRRLQLGTDSELDVAFDNAVKLTDGEDSEIPLELVGLGVRESLLPDYMHIVFEQGSSSGTGRHQFGPCGRLATKMSRHFELLRRSAKLIALLTLKAPRHQSHAPLGWGLWVLRRASVVKSKKGEHYN